MAHLGARRRLPILVFLALACVLVAGIVDAAPVYPVKVGPTGRYLVDQQNVPFFMAGDAPQAMIGNISEADAETYFANRQALGYNTVWILLLCDGPNSCNSDNTTFDGIAPFTTPLDLATPNEAYFARVDRIVQIAAQHGFLVMLNPIETIFWLDVLKANGVDKARAYGQYLGQRYAGVDNIVWIHGCDFQTWRTDPAGVAAVQAVARGIADFDTQHLQSVQLDYFSSNSLDDPSWAPLIQYNAAYTDYPQYMEVLRAYNLPNALPTYLHETGYEGEHYTEQFGLGSTPRHLREQAYWTFLSGGMGHIFGNTYIWQFLAGWQNNLNTTGAIQFGRAAALFQSRAWYDLVPDQTHTLVTGGYGTFGGVDYVTAARTPDGRLAMAYTPSARTLTVDMSRLSGAATARWYDPAAGTFVSIAGSPFANSGARTFATPGDNTDGAGNTDWVLVLEAVTVPGAATLIAPSGSIATTTPTFTWNAVTGATQYLLWLDDSSGGRLRQSYTATETGCAGGTGTCSIAPGIALNPGAARWWIVASNTAGSGPWSARKDFTVPGAPPPGQATLIAPSGTIATSTPTFTWNAVSGATQYLLWLDDSSGGRVRQWYSASLTACAAGTGTCSLASPVTLTPGAGRWWIVAGNASGSGPWSAQMNFTVAGTPPPGQVTLVGPSGSIATSTPTFTWNAASGATQYLLWLDDSSGGRVRQWFPATQTGCAGGTGTCSLASPVTLTPGAGRWWIVAGNASGSGPWSAQMDFTVTGTPPPGQATLIAPSGSIASSTPTFAWHAVSGATQYLLWLDDSSGGRVRQWYSATQTGCAGGTGTCSLASPVTLNPGAGRWWIVTGNASGSGAWSAEKNFTVAGIPPPGQATLLTPSGSIASSTPTFTWNAVSGATLYLLWLDDSSGGRVRQWYSATQTGCASGSGTCSLASPVVLSSGAGRWWIVTGNASGSGPWSAEMDFTVP